MQILITGGTGSFGRALTKKLLLRDDIERIAIYSRGEHLQEDMARELQDERLRFFIGDIRDEGRLVMALKNIDSVVHAAALKVVPTCEYNPFEAVQTNIVGAENLVKATLRTKVKQVIALSTDKAVNPINLYGATKLAAEKIFLAANALAAGDCAYSVCRYGNVIGSRGSVLPLFKRLAAEGKPLTITDDRMTRFMISMDQATEFVMRCLKKMRGREIFIPKIPSAEIMAIARAISDNFSITGIRPGEKLHEVLITEDEAKNTWDDLWRYVICDVNNYARNNLDSYAVRCSPDFRYSSDTNSKWLSSEDIKGLL